MPLALSVVTVYRLWFIFPWETRPVAIQWVRVRVPRFERLDLSSSSTQIVKS